MRKSSFTHGTRFAFGHGGDQSGYGNFRLKQFNFASILLVATPAARVFSNRRARASTTGGNAVYANKRMDKPDEVKMVSGNWTEEFNDDLDDGVPWMSSVSYRLQLNHVSCVTPMLSTKSMQGQVSWRGFTRCASDTWFHAAAVRTQAVKKKLGFH